MSWFMATIYDRFMRDMESACGHAWRHELISGLRGDVLEVGAGTGRNLDHYAHLDRLILAEPDPHMRKRLSQRSALASPANILNIVPWTAEDIEADDTSFDAVVSTLVLCSVDHPMRTLREIHRVLKPTGKLVFMEHVAATNPGLRVWQRRIEPLWGLVAGHCRLCRDTEASILASGFSLERITRENARKALPIVRPTIRGFARPTATAPL